MSERLVECVPNFSEGRDAVAIEAIVAELRGVEGVVVLDVDPGRDTNRTVVTFVGPPETVGEAAFRAIRKAAEILDMRRHQGAHPRQGSTDVCPFVPVAGVSMDDCVAIARQLGARVGAELGIPVYLYERAAQLPERRSLARIRAGEYEALPDKLARPEWKPDFGPAAFHPKVGVVTIGAREFLIAYNVNLNTRSKALAEDIAFELREKGRAARRGQTGATYASGRLLKYEPSRGVWPCAYCEAILRGHGPLAEHYQGAHGRDFDEELAFFERDPAALEGRNVQKKGRFRECRAVGWYIPEYGRAQISFNLTDFHVTPAHAVLEACRELAGARGLVVTGSEIVGMLPWEALRESGEFYLARQGSSRGMPVPDLVDTAVQSMGLDDLRPFDARKSVLGLPTGPGPLVEMRLGDFADELSRNSPAPGGGSASALSGALAAALGSMVANLTFAKPGLEERREEMELLARECQELKQALLAAVDEDTRAFGHVLTALRLPQGSAEQERTREAAIQEGYRCATDVPLRTAELCLAALRCCRTAAEKGLPASASDAAVGALLARAGVLGAAANVEINLPALTDAAWVAERHARLANCCRQADELERAVRARLAAPLPQPSAARAGDG